jgi:hypothetical protein
VTRVGRMLRNVLERLAKRYYEGPEPPLRYAGQVVAFAKSHPQATREQWAQFATNLARGAYRAGWTRGFEWTERDLDQLRPDDPERLVDQYAHDWTWHAPDALTSDELTQVVAGDFLSQLPDDEARARYLDVLGRYYGTFRVVVMPSRASGGRPS